MALSETSGVAKSARRSVSQWRGLKEIEIMEKEKEKEKYGSAIMYCESNEE